MTVLLLIKNIFLKVKMLLFNFSPSLTFEKYPVSLVAFIDLINKSVDLFRSLIKIWNMTRFISNPDDSPLVSTESSTLPFRHVGFFGLV